MKKGPEFDQLPTPLRDFLQKEARGDIPFWSTIGMETMDAKTGWSRVRVRFSRVLINSNGVLHGGIVFSAADAATAVALLSLLKEGERMATAEMKNQLPQTGGRCRHRGRSQNPSPWRAHGRRRRDGLGRCGQPGGQSPGHVCDCQKNGGHRAQGARPKAPNPKGPKGRERRLIKMERPSIYSCRSAPCAGWH